MGEGRAPLRRGERTGWSTLGVRASPSPRPGQDLRPPLEENPHGSFERRERDPHPASACAFPARLSDPGAAELRRGLYVDCETTGFSPEHDAVIELALLPFTYTLAGTVVEVLHDEAQAHRNDPGRPLPAEITHLTGLTDDDVRGERIDVEAASALIERSGLIVAHNARFDRRSSSGCSRPRARGPGRARARRFRGPRRGSRARRCTVCSAPTGSSPGTGTSALADCEAGAWLLAQRLPVSGEPVLAAMRRRALTPTVRLWAIRSPFESKEALRARGYRWMPEMRDGIERSWWTDVEPDEAESELAWLREAVYGGTWGYLPPGGIPQRCVTAFDRWRTDPSDLAHPASVVAGALGPAAG